MSGRRQFDEDSVLNAAMTAFWRSGFEATSVADLEQATGLNKSSLYNAYGRKDALYERCLERFSELHGQQLLPALEGADFPADLERFFDRLIARFESGDVPTGCFMTMAAMEVGGRASAAAKRIEANLEAMRMAFRQRCRRAMAEGQLPENTDCDAMAAMLLAMTRGIAVLNRGYGDTAVVRDAVRGMVAGISGRA